MILFREHRLIFQLPDPLQRRISSLGLDPSAQDPFSASVEVGPPRSVLNADEVESLLRPIAAGPGGRPNPALAGVMKLFGREPKVGDVLRGPAKVNLRSADPFAELRGEFEDPRTADQFRERIEEFLTVRDLFDAFQSGKEFDQATALREFGPDIAFQDLQGIKGLFDIGQGGDLQDSFLRLMQQNPDKSGEELKAALDTIQTLGGELESFARRATFGTTTAEKERAAINRDNVKALLERLGQSKIVSEALARGSGEIATDEIDRLNAIDPAGLTGEQGSKAARDRALQPQRAAIERKIEGLKRGMERAKGLPGTTSEQLASLERQLAEEQRSLAELNARFRDEEPKIDLHKGQKVFVEGTTKPTARTIREQGITGAGAGAADATGIEQPPLPPDPSSAPRKSGSKAGARDASGDNPIGQDIAAGYEEYDALLNAHEQARDIRIEGARERDEDFQDYLDRWQQDYKQAYDATQKILDDTRRRTEDQIAKKQKLEEQKLQWQKNEELRDLKREEMDAVEQKIFDLAMSGGFASGNGIKAIREAEFAYKLAAIDLKLQFQTKETEISTKYTDKYIEIQNQYQIDSDENLKEYKSELQRLQGQSYASTQAREEAEEKAETDWMIKQEEVNVQRANAIREEAAKMKEDAREDEEAEEERRQQAWENLVDTFEKTNPGSQLRDIAIKNAEIAGVDISGIDPNEALPIESSAKQLQEEEAALWDIQPYVNDKEKLGLITSAQAIANLAVRDQVNNVYGTFKGLIDAGYHDQAISTMKNFARSQMTAGIKRSFNDRNVIVRSTGKLLAKLDKVRNTDQAKKFFDSFGELGEEMNERADKADGYDNLKQSDFNWYTKELQRLRNVFGMDKNPELQEVFAEVENIAGIIINERYGAAVTDGEMARAREYIAMSGNTLEDMKIKMRVFGKFSAEQNREALAGEGLNLDILVEDFDATLPLSTKSEFDIAPTDDELNQMMNEMKDDFDAMGDVSYTGRNFVSKKFDGRRVELSRPVMIAFNKANEDFRRDFGMDIRVASEATASRRDQAETIRMMAERNGVPFDENNPNSAARKLREMGRQIADVGASKHEIGEAVDLYPFDITIGNKRYSSAAYIALVKPYLERHGILQRNHGGRDPGNFEYSPIT